MRLFSLLATMFTLLILAGAAGVFFLFIHYGSDLPDYKKLAEYNPPTTTRLYAADGRLLDEYAIEKRLYVPISAIPNRLKNAFIAAEDQNFYYHPGVDISSILRAVVTNLNNIGSNRSLVGGSTITQQVVKNFLLTNERSFERKIKEAILAFRITQAFSKDRILELYLNEIYLGNGSHGVAAAALYYFDKSIDELTIEEAATLAAMPKAPSDLDPTRNPERAKTRRDWVIERMEEENYITDTEALLAKATPIKLRTRDQTTVVKAGYFSETVRQELIAMFNEDTVYKGGLTVHASINPSMQEIAHNSLRNGLIAYDKRHGYRGPVARIDDVHDWHTRLKEVASPAGALGWQLAVVLRTDAEKANIGIANSEDGAQGEIPLAEMKWARKFINRNAIGPAVTKPSDVLKQGDVVLVTLKDAASKTYKLMQVPEANGAILAMDPHTGKVLAMSGGFVFSAQSQFNRATQAKRQPGSAFKPFVYTAALEQGFTPASIIVDEEIILDQGENQPQWRPQNYSGKYYGPTTLRVGIEKSRNAMTVRLAQLMGIKPILNLTKRLDIITNPPRNFSLVLGASETTLVKLASAYATLVNGGKQLNPTFIDRVQDRNGFTLFRQDQRACHGCSSVITPLNASTIASSDEEASAEATEPLSIIPPMVVDNRKQIIDPITAYQTTSILEGVIQRGTGRSAHDLGRTLAGKTGTTDDSIDTWFMGFSADLVVGVYVGLDNPASLGKRETGASVALPIWKEFMKEALANQPDVPFRRPDGISLIKIDAKTGLLPGPDTPNSRIIYEAFRAGTEPSSASSDTPASVQDGENNVNFGSGGIY